MHECRERVSPDELEMVLLQLASANPLAYQLIEAQAWRFVVENSAAPSNRDPD